MSQIYQSPSLEINFLTQEQLATIDSCPKGALWLAEAIAITDYGEVSGISYLRLSNDVLIQWGILKPSDAPVTFPKEFATDSYALICGYSGLESTASTLTRYAQAGVKTSTGFYARCRYNTTTSTEEVDWIAIGKGA
jgi:hypothetical protein